MTQTLCLLHEHEVETITQALRLCAKACADDGGLLNADEIRAIADRLEAGTDVIELLVYSVEILTAAGPRLTLYGSEGPRSRAIAELMDEGYHRRQIGTGEQVVEFPGAVGRG